MANATIDVKTDKVGTEDFPDLPLLALPMEANTQIFGGTMVATNAAGNAIPASAAGAKTVWGICNKGVNNLTANNAPFGAAGAQFVLVRKGPFYMNQDASIAQANVGQNCFVSDDNTVSLSDNGGARLYAGVIQALPKNATRALATTDQVPVWLGLPNAYAANPELQTGAGQYKARAVVTSLQAYTGSGTGVLTETSNGAWAAQDGVTNAAGDIVFIQGGTTNLTAALDSGPWQITSLGSAGTKWVLTRPDWFAHGAVAPVATVIDIGGEGAIWGGTAWKSFAAVGSAVIDTNDPTFYVGRMTQSVALVLSTTTVSNVGIRSATKSQIVATFVVAGGTVTSTVGYGIIAAPTPGYIGTASAVVDALASGMTKNGTADTSTVAITVINW